VSFALKSFLEDPRRPPGTLSYHELQGFLFAVACSPDPIAPSEWMPIVFGDHDIEYESLDEAQRVIGELTSVYNDINAGVASEAAVLPSDCVIFEDGLANLEDHAPVSQWSRGFVCGHQWLEESWDPYIIDELADDYAALWMTLSFFASSGLAREFCEEARHPSLPEMASMLAEAFPQAVGDYAQLGLWIRQAIAEAEHHEPETRDGPKIGRNDACPCGSGRKYKKCCGAM
jgi:uncharacterized protein